MPGGLLQILNELYSRIKGARGEWRSFVLGALYGLVECTSSKVLLSVARVVLAVSVLLVCDFTFSLIWWRFFATLSFVTKLLELLN
jgi:hypothetical protein